MKKTLAIILSLLVGGTFGATLDKATTFDTKGVENVRVQVLIKEPNFNDAVYYTPEEWQTKSKTEIESEKVQRFNNWKAFVEEESKKEAPVEITSDEIIP